VQCARTAGGRAADRLMLWSHTARALRPRVVDHSIGVPTVSSANRHLRIGFTCALGVDTMTTVGCHEPRPQAELDVTLTRRAVHHPPPSHHRCHLDAYMLCCARIGFLMSRGNGGTIGGARHFSSLIRRRRREGEGRERGNAKQRLLPSRRAELASSWPPPA
jgi:hypothetical protein